ncbi:MAG: glycosyltransferase [Sulfuricurvum sp.]|uniref:glycosyltransferase family protein n=1 Tax=Sulfuricurvum sp. TaxID=2025608 RepID=UPI00356B2967
MKIVHVASYNYLKDGQSYYATDYKIHQGLVRNGHFVYPFSYRDTARCANIFGSKKWGVGKTNKRLIETCRNIRPDLLLMAHAELITLETLHEIRKMIPSIKIAMWFVDPLWANHHIANIHSKLPALDIFFATTGGKLLQQFKLPTNQVAYIPNICDSSIETHKNFEISDLSIDFLFCGRDYKEPERQSFLVETYERLIFCNSRFFGCLGNPLIFGHDYMDTLGKAKIGLSYNRRNDVSLYMSDRIVQLAGNGILTFTPRIPQMEILYNEDEVVYFNDVEDLIAKVAHFTSDDDERRQIAYKGWKKTHNSFNSTRVTQFMLETIFNEKYSAPYEWHSEVF